MLGCFSFGLFSKLDQILNLYNFYLCQY